MTAADLAAAQRELGFPNAQMARALRIGDRAYRRLLAGERGVTGPVSRVIEALLAGWRPADFPPESAGKNAQ